MNDIIIFYSFYSLVLQLSFVKIFKYIKRIALTRGMDKRIDRYEGRKMVSCFHKDLTETE